MSTQTTADDPQVTRDRFAAQLTELQIRRGVLVEQEQAAECGWEAALRAGEDLTPHAQARDDAQAQRVGVDRAIGRLGALLDEADAELKWLVDRAEATAALAVLEARMPALRERNEALTGLPSAAADQVAAIATGYRAAYKEALDGTVEFNAEAERLRSRFAALGLSVSVPSAPDWETLMDAELRDTDVWGVHLDGKRQIRGADIATGLGNVARSRLYWQARSGH